MNSEWNEANLDKKKEKPKTKCYFSLVKIVLCFFYISKDEEDEEEEENNSSNWAYGIYK